MISRRQFAMGALAMTSDGLVRPINAPPEGKLPIGVQPGVSNAVVIANKVIVFGPGGGIFVYSPIPGHGNLVYSIAAAGGTDPYGNAYQAGATNYFGATRVQVFSGQVILSDGFSNGIIGINIGAIGAPTHSLQITTAFGTWVDGSLFLPPSGDTTGTQDALRFNNAISGMPANGGKIILGAGDWYLKPGAVTISVAKPVWIMAHGAFIHTVAGASGDLIRWFDSTNPVGRNYFGGGWIGGIIDGTSASAGVTAIHFGDIEAAVFRDLTIQNFSGAGSQSLRLDNSLWWTEEADMRVVVVNCPGPTFEVTNGSTSFGYGNFDFTVISNVGLNGVQILNGAFVYHGSLRIRGNFFGNSSAVTNFAFGMSGVCPGGPSAGALSLMQAMRFEMQVECATAAFTPQAIVMDSVHFAFANELEGIIDLSNGSGTFAPSTIAVGQFGFTGMMNANGDTALSPVEGYWSNTAAPVIYKQVANFFQLVFPTPIADMFSATLGGNWTVALTAAGINGNQTLPYPQRVDIYIKQSGAGGNTVTWPHPGAPTLANPIITWPGGVAPVMTAAANALDHYVLTTLDGIHWDGVPHQNIS